MGSVVAGGDVLRKSGQDLLDAVSLPGSSAKRVAEEVLQRGEAGERVQDAGVPPINFGGLDEAFSGVASPGWEGADEVEAFQ